MAGSHPWDLYDYYWSCWDNHKHLVMEHLTFFEVVLVIASAIFGIYGIYQFLKAINYEEKN